VTTRALAESQAAHDRDRAEWQARRDHLARAENLLEERVRQL
jgi:hypothetical protein